MKLNRLTSYNVKVRSNVLVEEDPSQTCRNFPTSEFESFDNHTSSCQAGEHQSDLSREEYCFTAIKLLMKATIQEDNQTNR